MKLVICVYVVGCVYVLFIVCGRRLECIRYLYLVLGLLFVSKVFLSRSSILKGCFIFYLILSLYFSSLYLVFLVNGYLS